MYLNSHSVSGIQVTLFVQPTICSQVGMNRHLSHEIQNLGEVILLNLFFIQPKEIKYNAQVKFQARKFPNDHEN